MSTYGLGHEDGGSNDRKASNDDIKCRLDLVDRVIDHQSAEHQAECGAFRRQVKDCQGSSELSSTYHNPTIKSMVKSSVRTTIPRSRDVVGTPLRRQYTLHRITADRYINTIRQLDITVRMVPVRVRRKIPCKMIDTTRAGMTKATVAVMLNS